MFSPKSFGLRDNSNDSMEFIEAVQQNPSKVYRGYRYSYRFRDFGRASFIITAEDGCGDILSVDTHFDGDTFLKMRIEKKLADESGQVSCLCMALFGLPIVLPVSFIISDILPGYSQDDLVRFNGSAFLTPGRFGIFDTLEEANASLPMSEYKKDNLEYGLSDGVIFPGDGVSSMESYVSGTIKNMMEYRMPCPDGKHAYALFVCIVNTMIGDLPFVIPPSEIEDADQLFALLGEKSMYLAGAFRLSGNVAIDSQDGDRMLDEEHLLRLFRSCKTDGDYGRIAPYISDDCIYEGYNNQRKGKKAILEYMDYVSDAMRRGLAPKQSDRMATIAIINHPKRARYSTGKRVIASYNSYENWVNGKYLSLCAIELDDECRIRAIRFIYDDTYRIREDLVPLERRLEANANPKIVNRTSEEWEDFIVGWISGYPINVACLGGGLRKDCTADIEGKLLSERDSVFLSLTSYLEHLRLTAAGEMPHLSITTDLDGFIERIEIAR